MKEYIFLLVLLIAAYGYAEGQALPDSVIQQYESAKTDKDKLAYLYAYFNKLRVDSTFFQKSTAIIDFLRSKNDTEAIDRIQLGINDQFAKTGNYAAALASTLEITNRLEKEKNKNKILHAYRALSTTYYYAGDKQLDVVYGKKALQIALELNYFSALAGIANNLSTSYSQNNLPDSALLYGRMAVMYARKYHNSEDQNMTLGTLAEAFIASGQYDSALFYLRYSEQDLGRDWSLSDQHDLSRVWSLNDFSQVFLETNHYDSSKYYAHRAISIASVARFQDQLQRAYEYLAQAHYKTHQPDSAYKYLQLAVSLRDSLYSKDKTKQVRAIMAREQARVQQAEKDRIDFQNKSRVYGLISGLVVLGIIVFLLYRNNRQKQKANVTLQEQKAKVENTLQELKVTQQQLVQSEKMASLGELTAGIAHEIQNPLNFVNNFSEVSTELIEEMNTELARGELEAVKAIFNDLKQNLEKINHHGKRADAIVKGMLQHSRTRSTQKELTDLNALTDEYLRLAYHGLRAKDKSFNASFETNLGASLPKINVVPQDIGRVILNLINNAFYAVNEKQKSADTGYKPTVIVSSGFPLSPERRMSEEQGEGKIEISIRDNGNGIPEKIKDKIFQPFFTTKPTGQGTGLGLSLSYDIIKAQGGELNVETQEGEGTTFIISLPIL